MSQTKSKDKIWNIQHKRADRSADGAVSEIAHGLGVSEVLARLLYIRGYTTCEAAKRFICLEDNFFHDPFLMPDMSAATDRIAASVASHEKIMIYGDYDADGVTATTVLYLYLKEKGADVSYYIPSRTGDGYGVSRSAIDEFASAGIGLIITVDTGITAIDEVEYADSLGIDTVVTDHHECQAQIPEAVAVVNPKRLDSIYPFKELAGVGVVFKLICAYETRLCKASGRPVIDGIRDICNRYADIISVGTVADVMPLTDENRLIVSYGLAMLERTDKHGLAALIEASSPSSAAKGTKRKLTTGFIGYTIAPRINAAGRMSNASIAVELLLSESKDRAAELAEELCEINRTRQVEENKIAEAAYEKIEATHDFEHDPVIVVDDDGWMQGVIGIVASKITEKYSLPSIIVTFDNNGKESAYDDDGKGSGRSVKGFNLVEALVNCGDLLEKFGGHELAAGLTVKRYNLDAFKKKINDYAREKFMTEAVTASVDADLEVRARDITITLANELYRLEPYGTSNPAPVFYLDGASVLRITPIGAGKHTKLTLEADGLSFTALCFGKSPFELELYEGDEVELMFNLDINEFRGTKSTQLVVKDIRCKRGYEDELEANAARYKEIKDGAEFYAREDIVPDRSDFVRVYKLLKEKAAQGHDTITHKVMLSLIFDKGINYIKLKFIVDILSELSLVYIEPIEENGDTYRFRINTNAAKTDLEESRILMSLREKLI